MPNGDGGCSFCEAPGKPEGIDHEEGCPYKEKRMREQLKVTVTVDREWFRWSQENDVRSRLAGLIYSALTKCHHRLGDTGVQTMKVADGVGDALTIKAHYEDERGHFQED